MSPVRLMEPRAMEADVVDASHRHQQQNNNGHQTKPFPIHGEPKNSHYHMYHRSISRQPHIVVCTHTIDLASPLARSSRRGPILHAAAHQRAAGRAPRFFFSPSLTCVPDLDRINNNGRGKGAPCLPNDRLGERSLRRISVNIGGGNRLTCHWVVRMPLNCWKPPCASSRNKQRLLVLLI